MDLLVQESAVIKQSQCHRENSNLKTTLILIYELSFPSSRGQFSQQSRLVEGHLLMLTHDVAP